MILNLGSIKTQITLLRAFACAGGKQLPRMISAGLGGRGQYVVAAARVPTAVTIIGRAGCKMGRGKHCWDIGRTQHSAIEYCHRPCEYLWYAMYGETLSFFFRANHEITHHMIRCRLSRLRRMILLMQKTKHWAIRFARALRNADALGLCPLTTSMAKFVAEYCPYINLLSAKQKSKLPRLEKPVSPASTPWPNRQLS